MSLASPYLVTAALNTIGQGSVVIDVPASAPAVSLYAQWASLDLVAGIGGIALSNAVRIDLQ